MYLSKEYKLIIIGGGAAGFSAAIKAELEGIKTAMIERGTLGGTCINVGCVPSKNLLGIGENIISSNKPNYAAITLCNSSFDFTKAILDKDNLVKGLRQKKYSDVLSSFSNIDFIEGTASFISNRKIRVIKDKFHQDDNNIITERILLDSDKFIIATGSSPYIPSFKGIENVDYLTNVEALSLKEKPSSMIVIGGRALGLEFAQMFSRFGTKVTLLQRSERIIPEHEPEISTSLRNYLINEGIDILTNVEIIELHQKNETKSVSFKDKGELKTLETDNILIATGREPNTKNLSVENAGVSTRKKDNAIFVDLEMHTSSPNIWACGDVVGEPMLETIAAKEGAVAAENAINYTHKTIDFNSIPSAIFTSPQVASVGLTEKQTIEKYGFCSCKILEMNQVPKALIVNQIKGLIKMVVNPKENNKILGVHILSEMAADIIHEAIFAIKYNLTIDDIIDTVHVFPTLTESIKLVATSFKQNVEKLTCCAQ
ncbi:MAG: mercury(II) reductase [Nitrososphaeraceae archaeon]